MTGGALGAVSTAPRRCAGSKSNLSLKKEDLSIQWVIKQLRSEVNQLQELQLNLIIL